MSPIVEVHVRDITNRRIHKRWRYEGRHGLYTSEPESPDTSGAYEVMTPAEVSEAEASDLCRICFAEIEGAPA